MTYSNRVLNSTVRNADFPLSAKGTYPKGLKTHKERRRLRLHGYVALQSLPMESKVLGSPVEICWNLGSFAEKEKQRTNSDQGSP